MDSSGISLTLKAPVKQGERIHMSLSSSPFSMGRIAAEQLPELRVGDVFEGDGAEFLVVSLGWNPGDATSSSSPLVLLEAKKQVSEGQKECLVSRRGFSLAWITMSDKGAEGKRTDESGPLIARMVGETLDLSYVQGFIIPDEAAQLKSLLVNLALEQRFDLILTTGGTGVGPRDITPEATLAVIEKRLPGFERVMTAASLAKTPHGAISRAVAGTLGQGIIVNMPGSPKAVTECLEPLLPTFKHTLEKLQGDPSDCAALRK